MKVETMRKLFADGDVMMEAMLEAEYLQTVIKTTIGKAQDEAIADSKPKARPRSDFNLGQAGVPIDGKFWTQNLDKCFFYDQNCYMADAVDEPCELDSATDYKGHSLTFKQMQEWQCPPGMCKNVLLNTFCHIYVFRLHSVNVPTVR